VNRLAVWLLAALFGPDLSPTRLGLLAARLALLLGALLLALVLGELADILVDPTPTLPEEQQ
jgi:hypothetical protein